MNNLITQATELLEVCKAAGQTKTEDFRQAEWNNLGACLQLMVNNPELFPEAAIQETVLEMRLRIIGLISDFTSAGAHSKHRDGQ